MTANKFNITSIFTVLTQNALIKKMGIFQKYIDHFEAVILHLYLLFIPLSMKTFFLKLIKIFSSSSSKVTMWPGMQCFDDYASYGLR